MPVVVIGNLSVGGVGKTPVVLALVKALHTRGVTVGVISRGYGGQSQTEPVLVDENSTVDQSGDEAQLIAREAHCPVAICRDRYAAAQLLAKQYPSLQLIISDDGMQHYQLPRLLEIAVIDGQRGMGNGLCLPAGPLREPVQRLSAVDWVLVNGYSKELELPILKNPLSSIVVEPCLWRHIVSGKETPVSDRPWSLLNSVKKVVAIAAIGNPQRFFDTLNDLGVQAERTIAFDDHHQFTKADFVDFDDHIILMTTKDAVKCTHFAGDHWWALAIDIVLPDALIDAVNAVVTP